MEETLKTCDCDGNKIFRPQDTSDHPCKVIFVVEEGKKIPAHRDVLIKASPFFEKLLSSDMRESREGVVRLEMLTESVAGDLLEFIYTGCVQISDKDRAQDLIAMADYLFLPQLKSLAGSALIQMLNALNCVTLYRFAEMYDCKELTSGTTKFIFDNFKTVASREDFLDMSSNEVELWISSDEINVSAEEEVFEFILTWIGHNREERTKHFAELFRHVRLLHVSRDYMRSKMETNRLVKSSDGCLKILKDAVKSMDRKNNQTRNNINPRKSLKTPVILIFERGRGEHNLCYFPEEDSWCKAPTTIPPLRYRAFSCKDKLYLTTETFPGGDFNLSLYDSLTNSTTSLSTLSSSLALSKGIDPVCHIFVRGENEIYALVAERRGTSQKRDLSCITKFNPETNSWEDVSSFKWDSRRGICIINKDNFVYFLGGRIGYCCCFTFLSEAHRYDLTANKWEKMTDMNEKRCEAQGAAAHGKIFVVGGRGSPAAEDSESLIGMRSLRSCEVYDELTDEWQLIASLELPQHFSECRVAGLMCIDGTLYALVGYSDEFCSRRNTLSRQGHDVQHTSITIEYYDPENDVWKKKTTTPDKRLLSVDQACYMSVFKGSKFLRKVLISQKCNSPSQCENPDPETQLDMRDKHRCLIA